MFDFLASAPFLTANPAEEPEEPSVEPAPLAAAPIEPTPVFEAPSEAEPAELLTVPAKPEAQEPAPPQAADHEIAATAAQASRVESQPEPAPDPADRVETRRHAIHGEPEDPAPTGEAPRKAGWWNRRRTG